MTSRTIATLILGVFQVLLIVAGAYVAWWFGAYQEPLNPDPPLPTRIHVLPCSYGLASRVCVFERVSEARYSEETK